MLPRWITTAALNRPCSAWSGAPTTSTGEIPALSLTERLERDEHRFRQRVLVEQVLAGVCRQPELREHHDRGVGLGCPVRERQGPLGVDGRVADPDHRYARRDPCVAMAVQRCKRDLCAAHIRSIARVADLGRLPREIVPVSGILEPSTHLLPGAGREFVSK